MTEEQTGTTSDVVPPLLSVLTPGTTPEEVAALVAVLSALGGGAPAPAAPRSEWTDPARRLRATATTHPTPGRGAWRASALPR
ncbi:acyl-CoA carboxylase subunit epsilon [Nocardioides humi]|uniref:Acyl-CoA carboxylase epsilon subunit n=1 Tax=Nocardioides humi TaxID=449461 RepID=A0ABN2A7Y7_9ACTN|nr:acyl-CoA carboxylase subunit epsilon [Nocardioides humi]